MTAAQRRFYTEEDADERSSAVLGTRLVSPKTPVRKNAVHNFLMSAPLSLNIVQHHMNLGMDARAYDWSTQTVAAIKEGLRRMEQEASDA